MEYRYIKSITKQDLTEKMVFIGGPRQVGKTTFALSFLTPSAKDHPAYFNWDIVRRGREILKTEFPAQEPLIILDEIHKYKRWRNLLKGFYDEFYPRKTFLVTGSARLDHYRRGGDSLLGRYHYLRLHPYSLPELNKVSSTDDIQTLLKFGGFPEPLFKGSERFLRRWQRERSSRVLREDLRDLEQVKEISLLEILLDTLPSRVGSSLSIRNLQEDLQVAHETVARWITLFEYVYLTFRISPYGAPKIKAVKKEQKLYFWDWSVIEDAGARLENMLASLLLKYCHFIEDSEGYAMELRYIRDKEKREIDFVVLKNKKPIFAVECKSGEERMSPHLSYFAQRTPIPIFYQVHLKSRDYEAEGGKIRVLPLAKFCQAIGAV
jgi:predicted AAA+ superfamily ATPase